MLFIIGFILGCAVAVLPQVMPRLRRPTAAPTPDEETRRRAERALREYRNFMNYDGYAQQDDQT